MATGAVRQVNRDELIYVIQSAMRSWSASLRRDLNSTLEETRARARVMAATVIVEKALPRYEIMTSGSLPNTMGEDAFSGALDGVVGVRARKEPERKDGA